MLYEVITEEIDVLRAQSMQKKSELEEVNSKRENLLAELVLAQKKQHVIEDLRKNNAASDLEILDGQMRIQRLKSEIAEVTTIAPRLQAAQSEADRITSYNVCYTKLLRCAALGFDDCGSATWGDAS